MADDDSAPVNLSRKNLTEIPAEVLLRCKEVRELNLSKNPGIQLKNVLRQFTDVRKLSLDECDLHDILDEVCELMQQREEQDLHDNRICMGHNPPLARLHRLTVLSLSQCGLTSLPDSLGNICLLEELNLDGNNFSESLNPAIGRLLQLKKLNLSRCALTTLPDALGDLQLLQELYLNENSFSEGLNPAVGRLLGLKRIHLSRCGLKALPESLGDLTLLEELDVSGNVFTESLNTTVGRLHRLKKLELRGCGRYALCDSLGDHELLEELDLSSSGCEESLNATLGRRNRLKKLSLEGCFLRNLPHSLGHLKQLEALYLSGNNFYEGLSSAIGELHELKILYIRSCEMSTLPDTLGDLQMLETLDLSVNNFSNGLNGAIGRLTRLTNLQLTNCGLTSVPDTLGELQMLETLDLSSNRFSAGLNLPARRLCQLKSLIVRKSEISTFPDWLHDLPLLEELDLSYNCFVDGVKSSIERLIGLKVLALSNCFLETLPDSLGNMEKLETLKLEGNRFNNGVNQAIGHISELKRLNLRNCQLKTLPETLGDLNLLEEIDLTGNTFSENVFPTIGRLRRLIKLEIRAIFRLKTLPDSFGHLELLETLKLSGILFSDGLNPAIGRLGRLKMLELSRCGLRTLPESLGNLQSLNSLKLNDNRLERFPECIPRMKNLQKLDISNDRLQRHPLDDTLGNRIKILPVELAHTKLVELKYYGNPISEPPQEIWTQGLKAIKSYMLAIIPGKRLLIADTINMIGDTGAGKTSVAKSLVARIPTPTPEADRTRVVDQFSMSDDTNAGYSVNINDFGGHKIYHSIIPIFLPAKGLLMLVFNLSDPNQEKTVREWLLTVIAKSREYRIIIVGTHCDKVSGEQRLIFEKQMQELSKDVFKSAIREVDSHMRRLGEFSHSEKQTKLQDLKSNLQNADISVFTMSCLIRDGGLVKLYHAVRNALRGPVPLPVSWCRVMSGITNENSGALFITMKQVEDIGKAHLTTDDDSNAMTTILHYLAQTSQIIWIHDHPELKNVIFHSPKDIINACKGILHHDFAPAYAQNFLPTEIEEYNKGILSMPVIGELLAQQETTSQSESLSPPSGQTARVFTQLLAKFNIIGPTNATSECQKFIVPCNLPSDVTPQIITILGIEKRCLFKVTVQLTFIGAIIPLSFFERSQSLMLAVADDLQSHSHNGRDSVLPCDSYQCRTSVWKNGIIIIYDDVYFKAERTGMVITLTAFTKSRERSPWSVLHPILKDLNNNVTSHWHGAPPHCHIVCPLCSNPNLRQLCVSNMGEIMTTLNYLAACDMSDTRKQACSSCFESIPRCLCFPTTTESFEKQHAEIESFFKEIGRERSKIQETGEPSLDAIGSPSPGPPTKENIVIDNSRRATCNSSGPIIVSQGDNAVITMTFGNTGVSGHGATQATESQSGNSQWEAMDQRQLNKKFRSKYSELVATLTLPEVITISTVLFSCEMLIQPELEEVSLKSNTATNAATKLIDFILKKNDEKMYRTVLEVLQKTLGRNQLVKDLLSAHY